VLIFMFLAFSFVFPGPRQDFNTCKKIGGDCTYFKAKVFESDGNAGSAMDLYLRGGYYDDYIRLQTYSGADIAPIIKKYKIDAKKEYFYRGLSEYTKGKWQDAVDIFSERILKDYLPARSYLAYSYLMLGENEKAKKIVRDRPETVSPDDRIEYRKLEGLILYAENKQIDAKKVFMEVLASKPGDLMSLKYLAHILYRTGWFSKAERIYASLISKEWRDTELYYLLSERCEMRTRYLKFELASRDADRIIKEYPDRKDFTALWISWLLEHDDLELAQKYAKKLSSANTTYESGLYLFVQGLIEEFKLNDKEAVSYFEKAYQTYPAMEYDEKLKTARSNLEYMDEGEYKGPDCSKYKVRPLPGGKWLVESDIFGKTWPVNYSVEKKNAAYDVTLALKFLYSREINFEERSSMWIRYSQDIWSGSEMRLLIDKVPVDYPGVCTTINVLPWPSSFYSKRVSSHEWSVLTSPRTAAHEIGHLLGLDDEYYETDKRILDRNHDRYIGPRTSIMRNMLSGRPEKRHIHFLLSPIKCEYGRQSGLYEGQRVFCRL
jgi:hypothetical protein